MKLKLCKRAHCRNLVELSKFHPNTKKYCSELCQQKVLDKRNYRKLGKAGNAVKLLCYRFGFDTVADLNIFYRKHGRRCYICGRTQRQEGRRLCIDHDHSTGKLRGLLCWQHNFALGAFRDDPKLLKAALDYLKRANYCVQR